MKVYDLVHFYDNGEHYEDRVDYEEHYLYSTLEIATARYDWYTQDPKCIGGWSVFERELDDDCHTGTCLLHSEYIPCPSIYDNYFDEQLAAEQDAEMQAYWDEIEYAFREAAGLTYFSVEDWPSDWDTKTREEQLTRIAHQLADRHEHILVSDGSCQMVERFFKMYELSREERELFWLEYMAQHYFRYGYV